jgi:excisionase family DNA binding protein
VTRTAPRPRRSAAETAETAEFPNQPLTSTDTTKIIAAEIGVRSRRNTPHPQRTPATPFALGAALHALAAALAPTQGTDAGACGYFCGFNGEFCGNDHGPHHSSSDHPNAISAVSAVSAAAEPVPAEVGTTEPDELLTLTVEQAAKRLGIGRTTFYSLIGSGEIETITIGRLRRVPAEALPAYVARLRESQNTHHTAA